MVIHCSDTANRASPLDTERPCSSTMGMQRSHHERYSSRVIPASPCSEGPFATAILLPPDPDQSGGMFDAHSVTQRVWPGSLGPPVCHGG